MASPHASHPADPVDVDTLVHWVDYLFGAMNVGLLIYHLESPDDSRSLRLVYVNDAASEYTGADLHPLVGLHIGEAFPGLIESDLPERYTDVVRSGRARNVGVTSYGGDDNVEEGYYGVKAFPMPGECVGIVFENITTRKRLAELLRKQRESKR